MNYTIGDFLIQLKNAYMARKKKVQYPYSRMVSSMGQILTEERYLKTMEQKEEDGRKVLIIELLYKDRKPAIQEVTLVSKPSIHRYANKHKIKKTLRDYGISIVSTSKGMMTNRKAIKEGVGGEVICKIF